MKIKMMIVALLFCTVCCKSVLAQIKIDDVLGKVEGLLKTKQLLTVKKGFSPIFALGNLKLNKVGILGEQLKGIKVLGNIFDSKGVQDITKLYNTYKTGLVVFKVLAAAGTLAAGYSTIRGIAAKNNFNDKTVKALLLPGVTSLLTGVITKVLTKKASYKAVDIFNGVVKGIVKKKIGDIISMAPASSNAGLGIYVKL